ncbi:SLC13 family permease [Nocardiopsis dassonvillei]|uniref:GntT/GntP/DsdX family permease n=1 Tax=Nocardiopsis dassonvillei TaxID=2014 RepID=UPI00102CFCB2|nr:SLC13 family permease [Nocardiopsis dassonvillei]MCP3012849.1 SLC13 family permease [Nocardiopsis dassonvillei]
MDALVLALIALGAIGALLVLIIRFNVPAFVALLLVSVGTALATGMPFEDVVPTIVQGLGGTLGNVALLVGLGAMLGAIVEHSGGADALSERFSALLGPARVGVALLIASSVIAVPIFFDVAFIVLVPIIYAFSRAARLPSPMRIGLPIAGLMLFIHVVLPPHPGIVGSSVLTGADMGLVTLLGAALILPVGVIAHYTAKLLNRRAYAMLPSTAALYEQNTGEPGTGGTEPSGGTGGPGGTGAAGGTDGAGASDTAKVSARPRVEPQRPPSAAAVITVIAVPILMIGLQTVAGMFLEEGSASLRFLTMVGAPPFALLTGCLLALYLLGVRRGWSMRSVGSVMDAALAPAAVVVFVTGAGGAFAGVLTASGIGEVLSESMLGLGLPLLLLAFCLAALLRAAQGSATVSALTTSGLLAEAIASGGYSGLEVALVNLAIGCGAICLSHVNDSGFWIVSRYLGLSVRDALRTWSVLVTVLGTSGFALVSLTWALV